MADRKASASKPSGLVGMTSTRNSPAVGSSLSSVASMSSSARPKVCCVCGAGEFLPTKALVRCVRCKRFWHHNCHTPPVIRNMHDLQKPFSCTRCINKASNVQGTPSNLTPTSPFAAQGASESSSDFSCVISGCTRMPFKDLKSGRMICKHHSIHEKHKLSANKSRPQVAMKTARIDRHKVKPLEKSEHRAVFKDRKHKHSSMNKSFDSTGYKTNSGESSIGFDMRKPRAKKFDVSSAMHQPRRTQDYTKTTGYTNESSSSTNEMVRAQEQISEWIECHCGEQLQVNFKSWLRTHASENNNKNEWWPKLRDLICTAESISMFMKAIDCLNQAILFRLESEHPAGGTRFVWQVEQEDVENAIDLLNLNTEYPLSATRLMEVHACYHPCGILVPRDPDSVLPGRSLETFADDRRGRREGIQKYEYDGEGMDYEIPSPKPIAKLLSIQDNMGQTLSKLSSIETDQANRPARSNVLRHALAADHRDSRSPSVGLRGTDTLNMDNDEEYTPTLNLPQPQTQEDVERAMRALPTDTISEGFGELADQELKFCAPQGTSDGYQPLYNLPPSLSTVTGAMGTSNGYRSPYTRSSSLSNMAEPMGSSSGYKSPYTCSPSLSEMAGPMGSSSSSSAPKDSLAGKKHASETSSGSRKGKHRAGPSLMGAETSKQLQAPSELVPESMASSAISSEPASFVRHNSLAGTGYLWKAPPGSFEERNRARSGIVDAEMDEWLYGSKKLQPYEPKYPKPDRPIVRPQRLGFINPMTDPNRPPLSGEALERKRAEIAARPRRKERFGKGMSEEIKKERLEKYGCMYMVNPPGEMTPAYLEAKATLEKMIRVPNIDNYEPAVRNNKLGMRERPTTMITEIIDGKEVTRRKKKEELLWIDRHDAIVSIVFHHWRGY